MDIELIKTRLQYFYTRHKRLPTHGEMVKLLHYSSKGSTYYVVKRLLEEGIVERDEKGKLVPKNLFTIPMYGIIKAGFPIPAEIQYDNQLNLHVLFSNALTGSFALLVSGDSMIEAGICEGDYVIVNSKREAQNGDIVAAMVDGEWTVKYLQKQKERVVLLPANHKYPPIYPSIDLQIGGVVVNVIRKY
jgi:SOS regulatory protein LexA